MSERSFEELARVFEEKGLAGIMEARAGKTAETSVPMSSRHTRSLEKQVPTKAQA